MNTVEIGEDGYVLSLNKLSMLGKVKSAGKAPDI